VPSCAEAGVLGALCGTVGTIQATEVLKLILGVGDSLHGRLLLYDALAMEFRQVRIRKDPKCVLCGTPDDASTKVTALIDYDAWCGGAFGHTNEEEQKAADAAKAAREKVHAQRSKTAPKKPATKRAPSKKAKKATPKRASSMKAKKPTVKRAANKSKKSSKGS
jgi:adenylyltransferase/sulfurtransferase